MALVQKTTSTKAAIDLKSKSASRQRVFGWGDVWPWIPFCIAALVAIIYVRTFAVDAVCLDEWAFIPYLEQFNAGVLDYGQLLQWQYNEHKIFFPLVLFYWLVRLTHYDAKAVQYVGPVIMIATALMVLLMARKRLSKMPFAELMLGVIACYLLDLGQWQNMIVGYSACIVGASFLFVCCVYLLERVRKLDWRIPLAAVSGFCATFTYANGILCWPIGLVVLLLARQLAGAEIRKNFLLPILTWTATSAAVVLFYLQGSQFIRKNFSGNVGLQFLHDQPFAAVQLALASLGSPLSFEAYTAVATGLALFAILVFLAIVIARRKWLLSCDSVGPLALMLFGLTSAAMIFIGRAGGGFSALLMSRYTSIMNLDIVGLVMLVASLRTENAQQKTAIISCMIYAMFIAAASSGMLAISIGESCRKERLEAAVVLRNYKTMPDEQLQILCPFPQVIKLYAPYLEQQRYSVFRH
jgi:hypothetical protein